MKGSIRQRGETYTAYWWTADPATGAWKQRSKGGFATNKDAQSHLTATLAKVQTGEWRPDRKLTVKVLLEEHWLPARKSEGLRPTTLSMYQRVVSNWLVPYIGGTEVSRLSPAIVQGAMDKMKSERLGASGGKVKDGRVPERSSRSVQLAATVLKMATAWALRNELLGRDPLIGYRRPRSTSPTMHAWTAEEARKFLAATRDDRLGVGWALLLTRGLRRGELCGLRWSAVDLDGRVLRVVATRVTIDGKASVSAPKTSAGLRSIPLDDALVALIRSHWAKQAKERLAAGSDAYDDGGWVLADELGKPYDPNIVTKRFRVRAKALGLPAIRLHDTRHTAASLMLAGGTPVKVVSEVLGHASPTITLSTYAHVMPGMAEEAGERLSAQLLG